MSSVFSELVLADKLSKLNNTQQCIETLSHWCIFHQTNAEQVVSTWDQQFHKSEMVQKVPLLYLANDILQNSKRKGNEFVTEFWKVLPGALKDVIDKGDERGNKVVSRLVDIWEERKVFGSHKRSIKEAMLGEEVPPPLEVGKKRSRSIKIVRRDSRSIRTKLSIGGAAEKIVSAFHLVLGEHSNEDVQMSKCKSAGHRVRKMERDVDIACSNASDPKRKTLSKELADEENILSECIEKLKSVEATRLALVARLKEALHEQESELENVRTQMQVAQAQAEEAKDMRKRLDDEDYVSKPSSTTTTPPKTPAAIAAEVADKLTASSSSQMIMRSVLSTFAAQELQKSALTKASTSTTMAVSEPNMFMPAQQNNQYQPVLQNQTSASQPQYHMLPNPQPQQYMQNPGGIMNPYGYGNMPFSPPPHMLSPMVPLTQQQPLQMTQQPSAPPGFTALQPPGMVYYSHPYHSQ